MRVKTIFVISVMLTAMACGISAQHTTYVNFFWNQHQPSYLHRMTDTFDYPFTRIHCIRDYYFMASVLIDGRNNINTREIQGNEWVDTGEATGHGFPFVHITINISGVLLHQLMTYMEALAPCFEGADTPEELDLDLYPGGNPTDPAWNDDSALFERHFDLLCKPQANLTNQEKVFILYHSSWLTPREHHVFLYPSYAALEEKRQGPGGVNPDNWTDDELRDLKIWYSLSAFHSYFKETDEYILRGHDENGNEITDVVEGIKTYGGFKTWGTPEDEWFGEHGETLDPADMGGYSYGTGEEFELDGRICRHFTDWDALMIAIQQYKIIKFIIPIHRKLQNTVCPHTGYPQIEVVTTPYSHPILPLIYDTDNYLEQSPYSARVDDIDYAYHGAGEAAEGEFGPDDPAIYDDDCYNQVALGSRQYNRAFGKFPHGMWPGEGAVGETIAYAFRRNNIKWIASGNETCMASGHVDDPGRIYRIDEDDEYLDGDSTDAMSAWFRSEGDQIAYDGGYYSNGWYADADQLAYRVFEEHIIVDWGHDKFWSHCADGENAWGHFHRFGATFFEYAHLPGPIESYGLYYRMNRACSMIPPEQRWYGEYNLISSTPSSAIGIKNGEYVDGAPYPLDEQWELEPLAHGSWVNGNLDTWIGEENENQAWIHLRQTREDLDSVNASEWRFHPYEPFPTLEEDGRKAYFQYLAWDELYTAEGSDPFWWYGADQCFGSDEIFDDLFREYLVNVYVFAQKAGYDMPYPYMQVHPIISPGDNVNGHHENGAETDEDYMYDTEFPPGHGDMIMVPPITRNPQLSADSAPADGRTATLLTVEVFEDAAETSVITEVYINGEPIGLPEKIYLYDDGDLFNSGDAQSDDGVYTGRITVPEGIETGRYLLVIFARDSDEAFSKDYIFINVTEPYSPPIAPPRVVMAGMWDTHIQKGQSSMWRLLAWISDPENAGIEHVKFYYAGTRENPIDPPIQADEFELYDDGMHQDFNAGDGIYGFFFDGAEALPTGRHIIMLEIEDGYGRTFMHWPRLDIE